MCPLLDNINISFNLRVNVRFQRERPEFRVQSVTAFLLHVPVLHILFPAERPDDSLIQ